MSGGPAPSADVCTGQEERIAALEQAVEELQRIVADLLKPRVPTLEEQHQAFVARLRGGA